MKVPSSCGRFWMLEEDGVVQVGIQPDFLASIGVLWSFIPRTDKEFKEGQIFANIESSKRLAPFRCPLAGVVVDWTNKINRPDLITGDDWILKLKVKE